MPVIDHSLETLERLRRYDTCTIANAIEHFHVRLRNEGFTRPGLMCLSGKLPPVIGYAVTGRVKSSDPPMSGGSYLGRTDWWSDVELVPAPRIAVIEDVGDSPGAGAIAGEVHCQILRRLGCDALVTSGAVRDLPALCAMRFPVFARNVAVSHSYNHLVAFGEPVEVFGLPVHSGELLMGDCHGILSIPHEIVPRLVAVAAQLEAQERRIIDLCRSSAFSLDRLRQEVNNRPSISNA